MCSDKYEPETDLNVPLRIYFERVLELKIKAVLARLEGTDKAIIVAKEMADQGIKLAREQATKEVNTASGLMKDLMAGFPEQFVRKGDSDVALTEMKAKVDMLTSVTNKIDLSTLMPRSEYNIQHQQLSEKIGEAQSDIAEKTELARKTIEEKTSAIKENAELKIAGLDKKIQDVEKTVSNITGRIIGTGAAIIVAVAVIQILIHYFAK